MLYTLLLSVVLNIILNDLFVTTQLPIACVHNATHGLTLKGTASISKAVCCPSYPFKSDKICGGPERGLCLPILLPNISQRLDTPYKYRSDDRLDWPSKFFRRICHCRSHFFGPACESCWFGWEGDQCDQRIGYVRRNIHSLNTQEKHQYMLIMQRASTYPSGYAILDESYSNSSHFDPIENAVFHQATVQDYLAYIHYYATRTTRLKSFCDKINYLNFNHNGPALFVWHRHFILIWERYLRHIAFTEFGIRNFAMPYWDWVDQTECDVCSNDLFGESVPYYLNTTNIFHNRKTMCYSEMIKSANQKTCFIPCNSSPNRKPMYLRRKFNNTLVGFATSEDVIDSMSYKLYETPPHNETTCKSFRTATEGECGSYNSSEGFMHNRVHNLVTGEMCCGESSANDPIFGVHHSQVDRLFQAWYNRFRPSVTDYPDREKIIRYGLTPGQCRDCYMVGFLPLVRHQDMFTDTSELGYTYDSYQFGRVHIWPQSNSLSVDKHSTFPHKFAM